ncbi:hypothetical protein Pmani_021961 [Petrolisthes manimaculis]|uniref:Uncharacterized protein n=1 Tax=Petrolisthes manimaculis TaxID=1843537 RepID=A0AAE1U2K7_9EUCA|nr:hypothetical protein Pmani_021961 [Petrolisthes manimaculis]
MAQQQPQPCRVRTFRPRRNVLDELVLHNICKDRNIQLPEENYVVENPAGEIEDGGGNEAAPAGVPNDRLRCTDYFVNLRFG